MSQIRYALKDGELVFIDDVPNGLRCGCVCPSCGAKLEAHQGQKREHHFKHYNAEECLHGAETSLHIMAKKLVAQTRAVYVPNAPKNIYDLSPSGNRYQFDKAFLEKELSEGVRADVLLVQGKIELNVEIKVTHEVDELKKLKLFNNNIRTIEIDLSEMVDDFTETTVKDALLSGEHTELIYSPKAREIYAKWLLGDWKEVHRDRGQNVYVKNCPFSHKTAYFVAFNAYNDHGPDECHECYGAEEFRGQYFLCRGFYGNLDFGKIDKIEEIIRENNTIKYAEVIVNNEKKVFGKKTQ